MKHRKLLCFIPILLLLTLFLFGCDLTGSSPCEVHTLGEWVTDVAPTCTTGGSRHRSCENCSYTELSGTPPKGHTPGELTTVTPVGCEVMGVETGSCTDCGEPLQYFTEPLGHDIEEHEAKNPTCVSPGNLHYVACTRCDYTTYEEIPIAPNGHLLKYFEEKAPSCKEVGWYAYERCSLCDYTTYAERPVTAHTYTDASDATCNGCDFVRDLGCSHSVTVILIGYAPTCTAQGLTDGVRCKGCEAILTPQEPIAATGHTKEQHTGKAPTCTAGGYAPYETCRNCSYSTYEALAALGHDERQHAAQAPTCEAIGWDAYVTCSRCSYTTYQPKPATGHTYDGELDESCNTCGAVRDVTCSHAQTETLLGYAATCTAPGLSDGKKCTACGETLIPQTPTALLPHSTTSHAGKEPTCTAGGYHPYEDCENCDYTTYRERAPLGHDETEHAAQAPTCEAIGWDAYVTCTRCSYTTYEEKEALGHDEIPHAEKPSTCKEVGHKAYVTCSRCDHTTYEALPLGTHSYENGTCTVCGEKKAYTRIGNKVIFGSYPQTRVKDSTLIAALTATAPAEPKRAWTPYIYSDTDSTSPIMWYCDLSYNGERYRGIYIGSFRPNSNLNQQTNGYARNQIYWFKYEPLVWSILAEEGGRATLLCDTVIDSQAFNFHARRDGNYSLWAEASIREFLNGHFYTSAFSAAEQGVILATTLDNRTTGSLTHSRPGLDTVDNVFLLSYKDANYSSYGSLLTKEDLLRTPSDYALSQGLYWIARQNACIWMLRSAYDTTYTSQELYSAVFSTGTLDTQNVKTASVGVVPAITLQLSGDDPACHHPDTQEIVTQKATCTADGKKNVVCLWCDEVISRDVTIPATGHSLTQVEAKLATCYQNGYEAYEYCSRCSYTTYKAVLGGHEYVGGVCTRCNDGKYVSAGDTLTLGKYEQDNSTANGKEALTWTVLATDGDRALVTTTYAIDCLPWGNTLVEDCYWGNSSLRQWLATDFLDGAFTDAERELILSTTVHTAGYIARPDTEDKLFLLSAEEIEMYAVSFKLKATAYATAKGACEEMGSVMWSLRHFGTNSCPVVMADGIYYVGNYRDAVAIRPAMWIDASAI